MTTTNDTTEQDGTVQEGYTMDGNTRRDDALYYYSRSW